MIKFLQADSAPVGDNYELWEFPFGGTEASDILHEVNRSEPWSPEPASFILSDLGASKEIEEAVVEAFYRGLLRPGVAQA